MVDEDIPQHALIRSMTINPDCDTLTCKWHARLRQNEAGIYIEDVNIPPRAEEEIDETMFNPEVKRILVSATVPCNKSQS